MGVGLFHLAWKMAQDFRRDPGAARRVNRILDKHQGTRRRDCHWRRQKWLGRKRPLRARRLKWPGLRRPRWWLEGFEAFYDECDRSQCPYPHDGPDGEEWLTGYRAAEEEFDGGTGLGGSGLGASALSRHATGEEEFDDG